MEPADQLKIYNIMKANRVVPYSFGELATCEKILEYKLYGLEAASKGNYEAAVTHFLTAIELLEPKWPCYNALHFFLRFELVDLLDSARMNNFCVMSKSYMKTNSSWMDPELAYTPYKIDDVEGYRCKKIYTAKIMGLFHSANKNFIAADAEYKQGIQLSETLSSGFYSNLATYFREELISLQRYNSTNNYRSLLSQNTMCASAAAFVIQNENSQRLINEVNNLLKANDFSAHAVETLRTKIEELAKYIEIYRSATNLDNTTLQILNRIEQLKFCFDRFDQRLKDESSQLTVKNKLQLILMNIKECKIPEAYDEAKAALDSARTIVNPEYRTVPIDILLRAVDCLKLCKEGFELIRSYQAQQYADSIMTSIKNSIVNGNNRQFCASHPDSYRYKQPAAKIYEYQITQIRDTVIQGITKNWHKFHLRPLSLKGFETIILAFINLNLKPIGYKKWVSGLLFYGNTYDYSINRCEQMLPVLAWNLDYYQPAQEFKPTQEMAEVIANLNEALEQEQIPFAISVQELMHNVDEYNVSHYNDSDDHMLNRCVLM